MIGDKQKMPLAFVLLYGLVATAFMAGVCEETACGISKRFRGLYCFQALARRYSRASSQRIYC